jgi:hypothetical protein
VASGIARSSHLVREAELADLEAATVKRGRSFRLAVWRVTNFRARGLV